MKTFAAALLGALVAIVLLGGALWLAAGSGDVWQYRTARLLNLVRRDDRMIQRNDVRRDVVRVREPRERSDQQRDELQEQRRERLVLLTATLRTRPIGPLTPAEKHLFREAERERAQLSADGATIELIEPVQIDEWTLLRAGTAVAFERADRDTLITIRHEGARYQVSPCQTELRWISGDVCEE